MWPSAPGGAALCALFLSARPQRAGLAERAEGLVALATVVLACGVAGLVEGYGFIAVFVRAGMAVLVPVVVHGMAATPAMAWLDLRGREVAAPVTPVRADGGRAAPTVCR